MNKKLSLAKAAVVADEFTLTHKSVFVSPVRRETSVSDNKKLWSPKASGRPTFAAGESRAWFYCHKSGHLISACPALKRQKRQLS